MRKSLVSKVLSCAETGRERRRKKEAQRCPVSWSRPNVDTDTASRDPATPPPECGVAQPNHNTRLIKSVNGISRHAQFMQGQLSIAVTKAQNSTSRHESFPTSDPPPRPNFKKEKSKADGRKRNLECVAMKLEKEKGP